MLALGGLDAVPMLLPDEALFLYTCVRTEAVLSSRIEGMQSSLSDVAAAMQLLVAQGTARELTGKPRNRLFVYDRYLSILNEETEAS